MTDEQKADQIRALLAERRGYEVHGQADRIAEVDAQLHWLGHEAAAPVKRASTRTRKATEKR